VTTDPRRLRRGDFRVLREIPTRWSDQDAYGHLNNAVHYLIFDTALSSWQIEAAQVDVRTLPAIALVVETSCRYFSELHFPDLITVGINLERLGTSSVTYQIVLFGPDRDEPAAAGRFVEVYVDRETRRPVPVPPELRAALAQL
jgi:acyl-CoA thioester hydrolase